MCTQLTRTVDQLEETTDLNDQTRSGYDSSSVQLLPAKTNYHIHECFLSYLTDIILTVSRNVIYSGNIKSDRVTF